MKILIVEDEQALATGLKFNFEQEGFEVEHAADGATAMDLFQNGESPVDLVILDLMLPGMSGYEICRQIREIDPEVPVLVLSARTLSEDKARAFDCGSDQYVTKPFALPELLSRVRNLTERRRGGRGQHPRGEAPNAFVFSDVHVDFSRFSVRVRGKTHYLTTLEMDMLRYFIENEGQVLSRGRILEDVWRETADVTTRSVDNFVLRLRKIIEQNPSEPQHFLSVRGTGYRFVAQPAGFPQTEH